MKDLRSLIGVIQLMEPKDTSDTDTKTSLLDLKGYASAVVCVAVGTITGVDGSNYLVPVLQESDSTADASFTDVAADDILGSFTRIDSTSEDQICQCVGYRGTKRYIRVNLDYTGTAISTCYVGVTAIIGHAGKAPVTSPAAVAAT